MLFPSNAGTLSTSGGGDRLNFSKFESISPELMAKFCSILNDYRNGKIDLSQKISTDQLKKYGFDTSDYDEKLNQFNELEKGNRIIEDACKKLKSYNDKISNIDKLLKSNNFTNAFEANKKYCKKFNEKEIKKNELNKDKKIMN